MHSVNNFSDNLGSPLSELTNMIEEFFTHLPNLFGSESFLFFIVLFRIHPFIFHFLFVTLLSEIDITPLVLKFEVPALLLFIFLISLELVLVLFNLFQFIFEFPSLRVTSLSACLSFDSIIYCDFLTPSVPMTVKDLFIICILLKRAFNVLFLN